MLWLFLLVDTIGSRLADSLCFGQALLEARSQAALIADVDVLSSIPTAKDGPCQTSH